MNGCSSVCGVRLGASWILVEIVTTITSIYLYFICPPLADAMRTDSPTQQQNGLHSQCFDALCTTFYLDLIDWKPTRDAMRRDDVLLWLLATVTNQKCGSVPQCHDVMRLLDTLHRNIPVRVTSLTPCHVSRVQCDRDTRSAGEMSGTSV